MTILICHLHIFFYKVSVQVVLELDCLFIKLCGFLIYTRFKSFVRLMCYDIFLSVCGLSINGSFAKLKNFAKFLMKLLGY